MTNFEQPRKAEAPEDLGEHDMGPGLEEIPEIQREEKPAPSEIGIDRIDDFVDEQSRDDDELPEKKPTLH